MSSAPDRAELLALPDGQQLYWQQSGDPDGIPALYLHGGPGGTLGRGGYVDRFDLSRYRVTGFDQRGCGRSTPLAGHPEHDLDRNTTGRLVADVEALREHLGVTAWVVNGVSWGSTLALAYAQAHPDRVLGVVLMAVTTTSRFEVDWITETVGALYPEAWDAFAATAERLHPGHQRGRGRLVQAYADLLTSDDRVVRRAAATAWAAWEDVHVAIGAGGFARDPRWDDDTFTEVFATLVTHYWSHDGFCDPPLLQRMDRLAGIPATLIHRRLDVSGPLRTAWEVHRRWPGSELVVVEEEGHGGPAMVQAWSTANQHLADALRPGG